MRRLAQIGLVIFVIILVLLILYAAPPTRGFMESALGPPLANLTGGVSTAIAESWVWKDFIVPFPNQMIILGALLWIPMFYLFLRSRTKVRQLVSRGAAKDSGFSLPVSSPIASTPSGATIRPTTQTTKQTTPTQPPAETTPTETTESKEA